MMPELTRRRTDDRLDPWEIWYGDVQVGTIARQDWDRSEPGEVEMVLWLLSAHQQKMDRSKSAVLAAIADLSAVLRQKTKA
jgi:hypothetical protein